jgi:hypothetical protein
MQEFIPYEYDVLALPMKWLEFLDEVFKGDDDAQQKIAVIQEWFGYCPGPFAEPAQSASAVRRRWQR